jgi:Lrp/AsnC family leucine-responsive transcriptional regulator
LDSTCLSLHCGSKNTKKALFGKQNGRKIKFYFPKSLCTSENIHNFAPNKRLFAMAELIDETDLQILKTLQRNAKLTTKELADAVHLTPTPVFERQKRLEKKGYIKKYVAILDPEKLNQGLLVFCKVKLQQINHEMADSFTRRIMRIPEVTECYNTSGAYDYLLKVRARDMKQYQEFVLNKLGDIENISAIESTFVMSEIKQSYGLNI